MENLICNLEGWKNCEFIWAYSFVKFAQNNHPTRLFGPTRSMFHQLNESLCDHFWTKIYQNSTEILVCKIQKGNDFLKILWPSENILNCRRNNTLIVSKYWFCTWSSSELSPMDPDSNSELLLEFPPPWLLRIAGIGGEVTLSAPGGTGVGVDPRDESPPLVPFASLSSSCLRTLAACKAWNQTLWLQCLF